MGKKKFNKKESVRFALVAGVDQNGKPANTFKPIETRSKLSVQQKKQIISEFGNYEQIEINGKPIDESQIPSYILEEIRGRSDLVINQMNHREQQQQMQIDEDYEQYEQQQWEEGEWEQEGQWIDSQEKVQKKDEKLQKIQFEGKEYQLSEKQVKLLDCVLPENYEEFQIQGVKFSKFDEDGNPLEKKQMYEKYFVHEDQKRAVIDSFDYAPKRMVDFTDNDLKPSEIKGEIKEIQDALDYDGEEVAYEELEDDFFAQLLQNDTKPKKQEKQKSKIETGFKKKPKKLIEQNKINENKWEELELDEEDKKMLEEQITDEMLDKALQDFDNNMEEEKSSFSSFSIADIQSREDYLGKDGELDWRVLSKKQKKQYMKNKKIREFYDEVRERQIQEKMRNKKNVSTDELHLKQLVSHIPYKEDHVLQEAIQRDKQTPVGFDEQSDYETESDEDDIISYKHKTSIISSNLATVEEKTKKQKKKKEEVEGQKVKDIKLIKVVPQKRNKKETKEERKQRKEKLKEMKKQKRQQKQEFAEQFQSLKRKQAKIDNTHNPFHKVSCVKIA